MAKKNLKLVMYCRVGNPDQLEINKQEDKIQNYCKQRGYTKKKGCFKNGKGRKEDSCYIHQG